MNAVARKGIVCYVTLTDGEWVQESHYPFGEPAKKNEKSKAFFQQAFSGQPA